MKMAVMPLIGIFTVIGLRDNTTLFPSGQKSELATGPVCKGQVSNDTTEVLKGSPYAALCFHSPPRWIVLSFVAFLLSGTPSAVNQLVVTQIFIKDGQTTDTLASFLIVQCEHVTFVNFAV